MLAQAFRLNAFDKMIKQYYKEKRDILYGGYSAGAYILRRTLKGIHLADEPEQKPYDDEH